jgi:hypothetical protein
MNIFVLNILNMATKRIFEVISDKFQISETYSSGNFIEDRLSIGL